MSAAYFELSMVVLLGCSGKSSDDSAGAAISLPVEILPDREDPMIVWVEVTPDEDVDAKVLYGTDGAFNFETPSQHLPAGEASRIIVLGLESGTTNQVRLVGTTSNDGTAVTSKVTDVVTPPLREGFPFPEITGGANYTEPEVVCTNATIAGGETQPVFCMDREGRPRFVLDNPKGHLITMFRPLLDGNFVGTGEGDVTTWNVAGEALSSFTVEDFTGARFAHEQLDPREVLQITEGPWKGHFAVLTVSTEHIGKAEIDAHGIVVFDPATGAVDWDWSAHGNLGDGETIDPEKLDYDRLGLAVNFRDWDHANALLHGVDEDGRQFFWMSMRHQDWIIKIDCETDQVIWRFGRNGDFALSDADGNPLSDEYYMYQQHAPEWESRGGGKYDFLVYDNGFTRMGPSGVWEKEPYSRIMRYALDENAHTAKLVWSYGSSDPGDPTHFYANDHGDADLLPGGDAVLFLRQADANPFVAEVSYPGGELRWKAMFPDGSQIYRLDWFPSLYETTWRYDDAP